MTTFTATHKSQKFLTAGKILANAMETERLDNLDWATENQISIVHIFNPGHPMGGLTVAFRKSTPWVSGEMVDVAVATCSALDRFNRKVGTNIAITNFKNGNTISLPILLSFTSADINWAVKRTFSAFYSAM